MADTAIIGKVAVKVIPDTKDFKPKLQAELNKIEKQLKPIKVKLELGDTEAFKARVEELKADAERTLSEIKANVKPDLDETDKKHVQDELNGMDAEVQVKLSELWRRKAQATLALLARPRSVDLLPKVNKAFASKAALTLAALSGGRSIANIGEEVAEWAGELDKAVPKIAAVTLAVTNLGSSLLAGTSNLLSFGGSLASIGPAALAIPGILGGLAIGVTASIIAFKDFKKELPGVVSQFAELKKQISSNFWQEAKAPIQEFVQTLLPQFAAGMRSTSTELGGFFGKLATSLKGVFNGELGSMFADLQSSIRIASRYTDNFAGILRTLGKVGAGELPALAKWFGDISSKFDRFLRAAEKTGALQGWVDTGVDALKDLGSVIAGTSSTLAGLARAADKAGSGSLHELAGVMRGVARTVNSADFQKTLADVFEGAHQAMENIAKESGPQFRSFIDRLADTLGKALPKAGSAAGKAIGAIADALDQPVVEKAVIGFFTNLNKVVETLAPAMHPLARALAGVVDVIGALGTNIARGLAPLVEGLAPKVEDLAKHVVPLADALGDLLVQLIDLGLKGLPSLDGLVDALTGITRAVTPIVAALNSLPSPIIAVIAQAALLALTLPKISAAFDTGIAKAKQFGASMTYASERTRMLAAGAQTAAGVAGLAALTASANTSNDALSALLQIGGTAAIGFAAGGPIGAAIGALAGTFGYVASKSAKAGNAALAAYQQIKQVKPVDQAKASLDDLKDTLDQVTGAYTGATRAAVLQKLQQAGLVETAAKFGISSRTLVNAALGQRNAMKDAGDVVEDYRRRIKELNTQIDQAGDINFKTASPEEVDAALKHVTALEKQKKALQEDLQTLKQMPGALRQMGKETRENAAATANYNGKLKGLPKAVKTEIKANGVEASVRDVAKIAKQYSLTPKQVKTVFEAAGIEPTKKQIQSVIDKMNSAKSAARSGGQQAGHEFGAGLSAGIQGWAGTIARQSADLVSNAINAARRAADSHSPSRKMIALGHDMGDGLSIGLKDREQDAAKAGHDLASAAGMGAGGSGDADRSAEFYKHGARLAQKLLDGLDSKLSQIKNLFAQNIKAGTDAADKALRGWFANTDAGVARMAHAFRAAMDELDKAKDKLKSLQQAETGLRQQTIDSIVSSGDPSQSGATTFAGVESSMQAAIERATQLREVMKQLLKEGLNKTTIKQILAAGPVAGLATAQAIQSMGQSGVDQVNALQKKLQGLANGIGKSTANAVYHSDIKKAMADVLDLEKVVTKMQARLEQAIKNMIDRLVQLLKQNKAKVAKAKADLAADKDSGPKSGSGGGGSGPTSGHAANRKVSGESAGVVNNVVNKTLNYYAAEGSSIDSEEDLFAAASRARMVDF